MAASGPLVGYKVIELAGIGPNPMCAMLLADMGAEVVRVDRVVDGGLGIPMDPKFSLLDRSRRSIAVDLKQPEGVELILRMAEQADALIEGFRPGVTERLGIGPEDCAKRNPKLVYGRVTGWGQEGPLAKAAGHDINYISLIGAAYAIGRPDTPPAPPLNLVGDFGGGGVYLALGVVAALLEAQKSGKGQVVDAAMVDGAASLMTAVYGMYAAGVMTDNRGQNILDGGAHFYDTYETSDGNFISIASIESKFYDELLSLTGFSDPEHKAHRDKGQWADMSTKMAALIKTKTRDEWCEIMEGTDVCFAPVLSIGEAPTHAHNRARDAFIEVDGVVNPAPAPRFSRTPANIQKGASAPGADTEQVLADWGIDAGEISQMKSGGVVA
ncbi:MAG: CaiB/BaiF CoA-transferase family protein [Pseudomonadota bacterium]